MYQAQGARQLFYFHLMEKLLILYKAQICMLPTIDDILKGLHPGLTLSLKNVKARPFFT
jgi:hypothetical protein